MVQNNKVLTVSYGTFSCTLEGFDDSFGTMKAIAEYFRDLAPDDRYFGAEPPQPDAEMLARIAQREITRQVEARTSEEGIHLRASDAPAAVVAAVPAAVAQDAQPEPEVAKVDDVVAPPVAETIEDVAETAPQEVVSEEAPEVVEVEAEEPVQAAATETAAEDDETETEDVDLAAVSAAVASSEIEAQDDTGEDLIAEAVEDAKDSAPAADSIAAKLERIRAVVANAPSEDELEFSEDQHADSLIEETAEDISEALILDEATLIQPVQEDENVEIAEALDRIDLVADLAEQAEAEKQDDSLFEELPEDSAEEDEGEDLNIVAAAQAADPEPEAQPKPKMRARIIKVKRADVEAAVAKGDLEEISEEEEDEPAQLSPDSSLSDEDEAELLRELAAVEADLLSPSDDTADDETAASDIQSEDTPEAVPTPQATESPPPAVAQERRSGRAQESDVSRLMAAADEKFEDPASSTSRETYSQLRAAVAAAEAEKSAGGTVGLDNDDEAYREDLASVVRPRRPVASDSKTPRRPELNQRPAPLKLVAEQRIDEKSEKPAGPIRPRRIAASQNDDAEYSGKGSEGGFAAYAAKSGAVELAELLEAAASYMSFVEGREQFSRPQLMNKVSQLESTDFNREDGLRSFGQLLRDGKIERTNSGRFTASGEIGFRPDERAAG